MKRYLVGIGMICTLLLGSGCNNRLDLIGTGGRLDYSKMIEMNLSGISLSEGGDGLTRAGETLLPMPLGESFRLYAFPKGKNEMNDTILTRTYTIQSRAGNPVLDAGQKKLSLPMGEIDIFLVGPSSVATPFGIYPEYDKDLVSSKTSLMVEAGANQFQAAPLRHRMAKVQVVVRKLDNANYEKFKVNNIVLMNQVRFGDFKFDDQGGSVIPSGEGLDEFTPVLTVDKTTGSTIATMYIVPRYEVQMRIGVYFECYRIGDPDNKVDRRMNSGIMEKMSLPAGELTRFTTEPKLSDQLQFRVRVMPWNDVSMSDEGLTTGDDETLFSYSGLDAPIALNGKRFWPDRSGRGQHAELVGDIRYNAEDLYYYAASRDAYIRVPDLGPLPVYTLELTAESTFGMDNVPVWCRAADGTRYLQVQLPGTQNNVSFQSPVSSEVFLNEYSTDKAYLEGIATYAFTKTASNLYYHRNGKQRNSRSGATQPYPLNDLRLAYWPGASVDGGRFTNDLSRFKLYAARLTTKDLTTVTDALANNYRDDMAAYSRIDLAKDYSSQAYIKSGLALDLRGETAPSTSLVPGKKVWPDLSGAGNHAVFTHSSNSYPTYNSSSKCYTFSGNSSGNEVLRLFSLGLANEFTLELVLNTAPVPGYGVPFSAYSLPSPEYQNRELVVFWPFQDRSTYIDTPYNPTDERTGMDVRIITPETALPYSIRGAVHTLSVTRNNGRLSARLNGVLFSSDIRTDVLLKTLLYVSIGGTNEPATYPYKGDVHAVRFYNRPLTENERKYNYQIDKAKYKILQ